MKKIIGGRDNKSRERSDAGEERKKVKTEVSSAKGVKRRKKR